MLGLVNINITSFDDFSKALYSNRQLFQCASPRLTSPRLALPCLASPHIALLCHALPRLTLPRFASPCLALPRLVSWCLTLPYLLICNYTRKRRNCLYLSAFGNTIVIYGLLLSSWGARLYLSSPASSRGATRRGDPDWVLPKMRCLTMSLVSRLPRLRLAMTGYQ